MIHQSLLGLLQSLPPDDCRRLSRLRIHPHPARALVTMHRAGMQPHAPIGVHPDTDGGVVMRAIPRTPVCAADAQAMADLHPPVRLLMRTTLPELKAWICVADLKAQIDELERSGIVGSLNVEPIAGRRGCWVISTSAGTKDERDEWLRAISHGAPRPPARPHTQPESLYVSVDGDTYRFRQRIVRLAARDGGFARWSKPHRAWRVKLSTGSIDWLRALGLRVILIPQDG